jgi:hypothetical protein
MTNLSINYSTQPSAGVLRIVSRGYSGTTIPSSFPAFLYRDSTACQPGETLTNVMLEYNRHSVVMLRRHIIFSSHLFGTNAIVKHGSYMLRKANMHN